MTFEYHRLVFIGDDDASGSIFFGSYFRYMSEALQCLFDELGHPISGQIADGVAAPAVHASCDFRLPVRSGEKLRQVVSIDLGRTSSFSSQHDFYRMDGSLAASGRMTRAWVDLATMSTVVSPKWFREAFAPQIAESGP